MQGVSVPVGAKVGVVEVHDERVPDRQLEGGNGDGAAGAVLAGIAFVESNGLSLRSWGTGERVLAIRQRRGLVAAHDQRVDRRADGSRIGLNIVT